MIAKIKYDDKEYLSYVFLEGLYNYRPRAIVFNTKEDKFEYLDKLKSDYSTERNYSIIIYFTKEMVYKKEIELPKYTLNKCYGYHWLINNKELLDNIFLGKEVDEKYKEIARQMNSSINLDTWTEIKNQEDADDLLDITGGLHDCYMLESKIKFDPCAPELKFIVSIQNKYEHTDEYDILFDFSGEIETNKFCPTVLERIYLTSILYDEEEGYVYWVNGNDELSLIDIPTHEYIKCRNFRWKLVEKEEE
jgi:hypothetical protein